MSHAAIVFLLAATVALVPLASRLGLGAAMAYLAAGVVAGPHALGLLSDPASLAHAAEFGVVIMLFVIGLELRPRELWRLRGPLVALGGAQVVGTTALLFLVSWAFGLEWRTALAIGAALAMSSTALALPALKERGLGAGPTGHGALSILLFQDIAVIPLLALLPMLAPGVVQEAVQGHSVLDALPVAARTPAALAILALALVATQWGAKHVFRWLARSRQHETMTAMALLLVAGIALVAGSVGLSAALGAFLGGVLLADSEYRHEIEADLEPFRGLFLGFFFATVGAGLNLPLLAGRPLEVVVLALGIFALKGVVLLLLATTARMPVSDRIPLALGLAQVGEFAFVLLGLSKGLGIVDPALAELLGGAVAVSMPLTPIALAIWWSTMRRNLSEPSASEGAVPEEIPSSDAPVLLAGFGRMGSMVGRVLKSQGVEVSVLDLDPGQIAQMRRIGLSPHFGDARRPELLQAAGLAKARLLVVAVDDEGDALEIVETAREIRPGIPVLVRVRDHRGAYRAIGTENVVPFRETFGTAMDIARSALNLLGWREARSHRAVELFRRHNEQSLRELAALDEGSADWLRALRTRVDEAATLVRDEPDARHVLDRAWDNESLRAEATGRGR